MPRQALRNQPAIIFFDEIDSVLRARQSGEEEWVRKVKNEFLVRLQEIQVRGQSSRQCDRRRSKSTASAGLDSGFSHDLCATRKSQAHVYFAALGHHDVCGTV